MEDLEPYQKNILWEHQYLFLSIIMFMELKFKKYKINDNRKMNNVGEKSISIRKTNEFRVNIKSVPT